MPNNWSTTALQNAVDQGILQGIDGNIEANAHLTRAQMAVVLNREFGTTKTDGLSGYTDTSADACITMIWPKQSIWAYNKSDRSLK